MKNFKKYLTIILLGIFAISCSKDDDNTLDESRPITKQDFLDKVIVSEYADGYLEIWVFDLDQDNEVKVSIIRKDYEALRIPLVLQNNFATFFGGDGKLLLSKDANGKLVLDEFINTYPPKRTVMFVANEPLSYVGKAYMENGTSYIGFSATHWGWSTIPSIQHTAEYSPSKGYSYWKSASNKLYLGVNIPAGVQWDVQAGPLMLIDRTGFTKPSIYKPL